MPELSYLNGQSGRAIANSHSIAESTGWGKQAPAEASMARTGDSGSQQQRERVSCSMGASALLQLADDVDGSSMIPRWLDLPVSELGCNAVTSECRTI